MNVVLRAMRGMLTALTIWCIGCSSFEPMIQSWLTHEPPAAPACMGDESDAPPANESASRAISFPLATGAEPGCGCTDCIAEEPVVIALASPPRVTPDAPLPALPSFIGIVREPQVPPPRG